MLQVKDTSKEEFEDAHEVVGDESKETERTCQECQVLH